MLKPGSLKRYHAITAGFPIKQMENIHIFAEWCKNEYQISQGELFTAKEVADGKYGRLFRVLLKLKNNQTDAPHKHDSIGHHKHDSVHKHDSAPRLLIKRELAHKHIAVHKHDSAPRDSNKSTNPLENSCDDLLAIPSPPSAQPRKAPPSATPKLSLVRFFFELIYKLINQVASSFRIQHIENYVWSSSWMECIVIQIINTAIY